MADVSTGRDGSGGTSKLAALESEARRRVVSRLWKTNPVLPVTAARATAEPVFLRKSLRSMNAFPGLRTVSIQNGAGRGKHM